MVDMKFKKLNIKNSKLIKKYKRVNKSKLIGQQFSRLRMGQTYYTMIVSTISAISLITMAFNLDVWILITVFPFILLATFGIGFFMDKKDINLEDYRKQVEMTSRKLNLNDIKTQEFNLLQTLFIVKALKENIDEEELFKEYENYKKRWS